MTDDLPADTPELEPAVTFDSARLIADVRRGDQASIEEAYRLTFATPLGRIVLLHALASIGNVGAPRGAETPAESNHTNGRGFAVLEIARLAGFDPVAVAAAGLTQTIEGARHERGYGHHPDSYGRPDVVFGDEHFDGGADDGGFDLVQPEPDRSDAADGSDGG